MHTWYRNIHFIFEHSFIGRQSWLASYFVPVYSLILVIASLTPFSGWRWPIDQLGAFLHYPLPYYVTRFDNVANLLLYIPLGIAVALSLRQQALTQLSAFLVACIYCAGLSFSIEFTQQFLPYRVASNLDILTNSLGGLLGAIMGISIARTAWLNQLLDWRTRIIKPGASADVGIILVFLWFVGQLNPSTALFSLFDLHKQDIQTLSILLLNPALLRNALEALLTFVHCLSIALFLQSILNQPKHRIQSLILLICMVLMLKMSFAWLMLKPIDFFQWVTIPSVMGVLLAYALLITLRTGGSKILLLLGFISLTGLNLLVYWAYSRLTVDAQSNLLLWNLGHLSSFTGLSYYISLLWPGMAWLCLIARKIADKQEEKALRALRKLKAKK